jgi:hypothetical protein
MTSTDSHRHDHAGGRLHNPEVGHEDTDIDVGTILRFGAGLAVTVFVCAIIVWLLFRVLDRQAAARDPQISPLARPAGQLPAGPHLETNERAALAKFRGEETKTLDGYGWVNQLGGVTHIPVDEAKKLLVQRGLPARQGATDALEGTHAYAMGEASGGRTVAGKPAGTTAAPAAAPTTPAAPAAEPGK